METIRRAIRQNCLRKCRRALGLKQKDVAKLLKVKSTSMISRWERGACLPDALNMLRLAALYRTMVDSMFADLVRCLREELRKREAATASKMQEGKR